MNFRQLFENKTPVTDYDTWSDKVAAAGGRVYPQPDRNRLVAQRWDGDIIGEFNLRTNQGYINRQQGVAEGSEDLDRQALDVADKLTTDKTLAKLNGMAHDSTIYRALERYFAKNNISTIIFNRVAAIVFKKLDEYGRRLSTDPRIQEQGVAEGLDSDKRSRLDDLIDQYRSATDPEAYYDLDGEYGDLDLIIAQIKQEFGDNVANKIEAGANKMHFGRQHHSIGNDPYDWKKSPRVTRSGKINKQDSDTMKRGIKSKLGVAEGKGDFAQAIENLHGWHEVESNNPDIRIWEFDDREGGHYAQGTVYYIEKTGRIQIEFEDRDGYHGGDVTDAFNSIGDAMNVLKNITVQVRPNTGKARDFDKLGGRTVAGPDDLYKTDRAGRKGTLNKSRMDTMKASSPYRKTGPEGQLPESGVEEATGDPKFDTMMKKVAKTPTQAQRNAERIRQKREREEETHKHFANGGGFGPSPADKLSIRKGVAEVSDDGYGYKSLSTKQIMKLIQSGNWEAVQDVVPGKHIQLRNNRNGKNTTVHVKQNMAEGSDEFEVQLDGQPVPGPYNDFDHARNKASKLISYQKGEVAEVYVNGKLKMRLKLNTPHQHFDEQGVDEGLKSKIAGAALAAANLLGSPAQAAQEPVKPITIAYVQIDGEVRKYNLGDKFSSAKEAEQFISGVLDKQGISGYTLDIKHGYPKQKQGVDENLRDWFKEKWVRFGPDGKIRGDCARGSESEGKPKCLPRAKAHALGKKGRASAAARKRREDPNANRAGAAINVATKKKTNEVQLDEKCWDTYKQVGMKEKSGRMVPNCVPKESQEQSEMCPECGGAMYSEAMINEKKDACYYKVKASAKVWPSAYASGRLVQCRKRGAASYGKKSESKIPKDMNENLQLPPNVVDLIKKIAQSDAAPEHKQAIIKSIIAKYQPIKDIAETPTPTRTAREKFNQGLKRTGFDPDAAAKRLTDLIAKQKAERERFEKENPAVYGNAPKASK